MPGHEPTTGFTLDDYRSLIRKTASQYQCVGFEVLSEASLPDRMAILRHDIDMPPSRALNLARVEAEQWIRSTYTVLLTGTLYSPFEADTRAILQQIVDLGHDVGLHFDADWHGIVSAQGLEDALRWETDILLRLLDLPAGRTVGMFSFHNTTPFTMSCKDRTYAGLLNAYAGVLQEQVEYTSDSNGYWIYRSWDELLEQDPSRIQILTHPAWWNEQDSEPAEKVCRLLESRSRDVWTWYRELLADAGRANISGVPTALDSLSDRLSGEGEQLIKLFLDGRREQAYLELYRRFDGLARDILRRCAGERFLTPNQLLDDLLDDETLRIDPVIAIAVLLGTSVSDLLGCTASEYMQLRKSRTGLLYRRDGEIGRDLQALFDLLGIVLGNLADWSKSISTPNSTPAEECARDGNQRQGAVTPTLYDWLRDHHESLDLSLQVVDAFLSARR